MSLNYGNLSLKVIELAPQTANSTTLRSRSFDENVGDNEIVFCSFVYNRIYLATTNL